MQSRADVIIVGAGCAGLSLLMRLLDNPAFQNRRIILVERSPKTLNDRTWCFWETGEGYFDSIVHHRWSELWLRHPQGDLPLDLDGYRYKMIRGIDFYRQAFARIDACDHVEVVYGEVEDIDTGPGRVTVNGLTYEAPYVFSSVLAEKPVIPDGTHYLLQHFRGWWIETAQDFFDASRADLMNFRTSQRHGCTFLYVLPVSPRSALVEYTLFTGERIADEAYDEGLREFLNDVLQLTDYRIDEVEDGVIPMTNLRFPARQGRVWYIGTAGGQTKASSGYTFRFIQKQSDAIAQKLSAGEDPDLHGEARRFRFYDSVLLRVLHEQRIAGADVFYRMFKRNPAHRVLKFLDNDTRFDEELRIMHSSDKSVFIPAAIREFGRLWD